MSFYNQIRFRYLFTMMRYAEAMAFHAGGDRLSSDEVWALYKASCYRSVVRSGYSARTGRDAIAVGVSLAACGRIPEGAQVLLEARSQGLLRNRPLYEAARSIAQYSPEAALDLLSGMDSLVSAGLRAALLLVLERSDAAEAILDEALSTGRDIVEPDILLLSANTAQGPKIKLARLNGFLARHKLSPAALKSNSEPISAANLTSETTPGSVRGPLVTITMPAYNTAGRIGASIGSLLAQTYRDIEVLVVDDCSTDATVAIVKDLVAQDDRVRLIERTQNGGPYAARNLALVNAQGEFVTCHDSDDWAHPEKIHRQVQPLLRNSNLNLTLSKWVRVQDDGTFCSTKLYPLTDLNPASPLFRRVSAIDRAGFYDNVRTGADSEYTARLKLLYGRRGWRQLQEPLVVGAHRQGSLMTDISTGTKQGEGMNPERLDYWEAWRARHVSALQNRAKLRVELQDSVSGP